MLERQKNSNIFRNSYSKGEKVLINYNIKMHNAVILSELNNQERLQSLPIFFFKASMTLPCLQNKI